MNHQTMFEAQARQRSLNLSPSSGTAVPDVCTCLITAKHNIDNSSTTLKWSKAPQSKPFNTPVAPTNLSNVGDVSIYLNTTLKDYYKGQIRRPALASQMRHHHNTATSYTTQIEWTKIEEGLQANNGSKSDMTEKPPYQPKLAVQQ